MRELKDFPDFRFEGAAITEHRNDGSKVAGRVEYGALNGDRTVGIGWHADKGGNRTTVFQPGSWRFEVIDDVVSFKRIAPDKGFTDLPHREADLYTVTPR